MGIHISKHKRQPMSYLYSFETVQDFCQILGEEIPVLAEHLVSITTIEQLNTCFDILQTSGLGRHIVQLAQFSHYPPTHETHAFWFRDYQRGRKNIKTGVWWRYNSIRNRIEMDCR